MLRLSRCHRPFLRHHSHRPFLRPPRRRRLFLPASPPHPLSRPYLPLYHLATDRQLLLNRAKHGCLQIVHQLVPLSLHLPFNRAPSHRQPFNLPMDRVVPFHLRTIQQTLQHRLLRRLSTLPSHRDRRNPPPCLRRTFPRKCHRTPRRLIQRLKML